jgi:hypothetical protein
VDREGLPAVIEVPEGRVVRLAARTSVLAGVVKVKLPAAQQLYQDLFADLRRGTGAAVIAAAAGDGFAFEPRDSREIKNGVFTHCLLHGLRTGQADTNKDGRIQVSELRDYVRQEVQRLTKGQQVPTVRAENLEFDFPVY